MSTLSLRKIKHDSSAVDNITLDSSGNTGFGISTPGARVDVSVPSGINMRLTKSSGSYLEYHDGAVARASISGLSGADGLSINTGTAHTERVRIDAAGRVITPYQTAFYTYTNNSTMNSSSKVPFDQAPLNIGNCFNTSTNTFTAPVAGTYYFSALVRYNQVGVTYSQTQIYINGGNTFQGHYSNTTNAASTYSGVPAVTLVNLSAGDTVNIYAVISGGGSFTYSGSESSFFGYLLG